MTTLTTLDRVCETCRHWFCYDDGEPAVVPADDKTASMLDAIFGPGQHLCANTRRQGHCRRYPPACGPDTGCDTKFDRFPITHTGMWCGEWRAKRAAEATTSEPALPFPDFFATLDSRTRNAIRQHAQSRGVTVTDWPTFFALNLYSVYNLGRSSIVRLFRAMHEADVLIPAEWLSHPDAKLTAAEIRQFLAAQHHTSHNPETP